MFHSDYPINSQENDCLNRTEFSKQLAKAILSYTKNDNFAISLCGKWGSGKTSILNMVVEEISNLTMNMPENRKPVIVKFNPWNYSDCTQLINQFFLAIQAQLKIFDGNEALSTIGNALQKYSSVLDYSAYIPVVGQYLAPVKDLFAGMGEHLTERADENNNIDEQKKKVIKALSEQEQKFVIIIDDIDRLNNVQIRAIFQLVNSLAGFPNMIYLLSFDREVVARALQEEQKCDGEEYLEKIIQVLFEVPEANKKLVNEAFFNRCAAIIYDESNGSANFDSEYWNVIFNNCISPFIKSIRDVNRIINAFEFKYGFMREEINYIDLLALTVLQICAPSIYQWINNNATILTGSVESAGGITGVAQKKNQTEYLDEFKMIYPKNPNLMLNILQSMFPKFSWRTGGYIYIQESNDELRRKYKAASSDRIKRYFNLSLEEIVINKKQVQDTIFKFTKEQLRKYFAQLLEEGLLIDYLHELLAFLTEIPQNRQGVIIEGLIEIETNDIAHERNNILSPIPAVRCNTVILEILKQGKQEKNATMLMDFINNSNAKQLSIISGIIEEIEEAYGRFGSSQNSSYQFISIADLEIIESMLVEKLKMFAEVECFFDYKGIESIYKLWRYLEKASFDEYVIKMLQNSVHVPKFLSLYVGMWVGGRTNGWSFENESFSEYIRKEDAYQKILSLKNTVNFSSMKHWFKEIAIAFFLWCNQENQDKHSVNRENVNALISQWEVK